MSRSREASAARARGPRLCATANATPQLQNKTKISDSLMRAHEHVLRPGPNSETRDQSGIAST